MDRLSFLENLFRHKSFVFGLLLVSVVASAAIIMPDDVVVDGTIQVLDLDASTVVISDASKSLDSSPVTAVELLHIDGVTSSLCGISQSCTFTNKTIDADLNTIQNLVPPNLKSAPGDANEVIGYDGFGAPTSFKVGTPNITSGVASANEVLLTDGLGNVNFEAVTASVVDSESATDGYVLTANGLGAAIWKIISVIAAQIDSESATDGFVLTADGAGGASWEANAGASWDPVRFEARLSGNQSISSSGNVKIQFNTEIEDSHGAFDPTTNYRFTVPVGRGGGYLCILRFQTANVATTSLHDAGLRKNGNDWVRDYTYAYQSGTDQMARVIHVSPLSAGDYVEAFTNSNDSSYTVASGTGELVSTFSCTQQWQN